MQIICFGSCPTFTSGVGSRSWLWMRNPSTVHAQGYSYPKGEVFTFFFWPPELKMQPNHTVGNPTEKLTPISFLQTFVSDKWQKIMCHCPQNEMKAFFSACMPWEWNLLYFFYTGCLVWPRRWTHLAMRKNEKKQNILFICQALHPPHLPPGIMEWRDNVKRGENGRNWHVFTPLKWCIWKLSSSTTLANCLVMTPKFLKHCRFSNGDSLGSRMTTSGVPVLLPF